MEGAEKISDEPLKGGPLQRSGLNLAAAVGSPHNSPKLPQPLQQIRGRGEAEELESSGACSDCSLFSCPPIL